MTAETFGIQGTECIEELDKLVKDIARTNNRKRKKEYFEEKITNGRKVVNKND